MPHAELVNHTPFSVTPLFLTDNDLRPVLVPLVRGLFDIGSNGSVMPSAQQIEPHLGGVFWGDDPMTSSYKFEPECAFTKLATDIALIGHACAPNAATTQLQVGLRVGSLQKVVRVTGDRMMTRRMGGWSMSSPEAFERIPLTYERAFGGWDRSSADPADHGFEPRNPVGTGFRCGSSGDDIVVPNLEDPSHLFSQPGDKPQPAGFGFTSPGWQPRIAYAGTYDQAWNDNRKPLLPKDFDSRFFNAASPGLVAPGYLKGDEAVLVANASTRGRLAFNLPAVAAPVCECELRGQRRHTIETKLDTVIIDTDRHQLHLLWRGHMPLPGGPHDLVSLTTRSASHMLPPTVEPA